LPAISIDLGEFLLSSCGPLNILNFLSLLESDLPYSPDKFVENPVNNVPAQYFQGALLAP